MLDPVDLSDHLLRGVVYSSLAVLALALVLALQIVWLRLRLKACRAHEVRFHAAWQPVMTAAMAGEIVEAPPLAQGDRICFLKLWNPLQEPLKGAARVPLNALAERCEIVPYVHGLLRRKGARPRLIALLTLGHLGDRSQWNDIVLLSREPDALLSLAAARAMLQIDPGCALHELMPQLLQREDWQTAHLAGLIAEHGTEDMFAYLADATYRLSGSTASPYLPQLRRLLRLLEAIPSRHAVPAARRVLAETPDEEVVAGCLRLLRSGSDLPAVRSRLGHESWIVRLQAARALGRIGIAEEAPSLAALLADPVWWVRYRSAQALVALLRGDREALLTLRGELSDRYARDMLDMVIAEEGTH